MSLRDRIAAEKAARASAVSMCIGCNVNVVEHAGSYCGTCLSTPKGPGVAPSGLVLSGTPLAEPAGLAATSMVQGRQLGYPDGGEHVPLRFASDGVDLRWSRLAHHYETDLCIVVHADNRECCWLAVRANDEHGPLLIHKMPLVFLDNDEPPF